MIIRYQYNMFDELEDVTDEPIAEGDLCNYSEYAALEGKYYELIMAVGSKYPGETRHETALRYIREAENIRGPNQACKEKINEQS